MSSRNIPEVFLDTEVAFDILSKRTPHFDESKILLELVAQGKIQLCISYLCIPNLIYLGYDMYKIKGYEHILKSFISVCQLIPTASKQVILEAIESKFKNKEDAVQYYTALYHKVDYYLTRNLKDYKNAHNSLPVFSLESFIAMI